MKDKKNSNHESFKVSADELLSKVKGIIKEFPLTIGAIGVVLAPVFAAVGAIAALATDCTIIVEKKEKQN
jgi:hypothetical protein